MYLKGIFLRLREEGPEIMWRVGIYLILMLAVSQTPIGGAIVAEEDKPQTDKGTTEKSAPSKPASPEVENDKASSSNSAVEEKTPDKDKKDGGGPEEAPSPAGKDRGFLRLAEPKSITEKKQTPKRIPWGGYWGAVYRRSPEEGDAYGGPEPLPPPKEARPPEKPTSLVEYKEVDFAKFASGSYASDYGGRYVKFDCRFVGLAPEGMRLKDFPPPDYINFIVVGKGSSMESLTVIASAELADKVFRMESDKEVTLYGLARRLGLSGLTLVVEEIEPHK